MTQPYSYQQLVWPVGGGEVVDDQIVALPAEVDPSQFLAYFEQQFGQATESAFTEVDDEQVPVGWVFPPPPHLRRLKEGVDLEVVVMPVLRDPGDPSMWTNFFVHQAQAKESFMSTMKSADVDADVVTVHQRELP